MSTKHSLKSSLMLDTVFSVRALQQWSIKHKEMRPKNWMRAFLIIQQNQKNGLATEKPCMVRREARGCVVSVGRRRHTFRQDKIPKLLL